MSLLGERSGPDRQMSKFYLYAAFVSTCMEDRAWSFCVSLSMQALGGMRMVSIEHFAEGIGQMVLSGHLGRAFDRVSRKTAIMSVVPVNNISIALAASMFIVCLTVDPNSPWYFVFLVLGILVCAINRLFLNAEKFLVSRDWVVVISNGGTLSSLNATLRALDQLTNVISPLIIGLLVTVSGLRVTCAIFGSFSLVSMASKAFFLRALYIRTPQLAQKQQEQKEEKENGYRIIFSEIRPFLRIDFQTKKSENRFWRKSPSLSRAFRTFCALILGRR
ncbi:hypothetical protein Q1695_004550 [Nippostrongylus brasiliensis]|nr:hypothetical protein Q1695_004550 [Nippostrongylus brasiliensis]